MKIIKNIGIVIITIAVIVAGLFILIVPWYLFISSLLDTMRQGFNNDSTPFMFLFGITSLVITGILLIGLSKLK